MARIESTRKAGRDRELKLSELKSDKELKVITEVELEKLKYSFEMQHQELKKQLKLKKAHFYVELNKQKSEKTAHARDPKLPYFEESKDKMEIYL